MPVVALAVLGMGRSLARGPTRIAGGGRRSGLAIAWSSFGQAAAMAVGGLAGVVLLRGPSLPPGTTARFPGGRSFAIACLCILAALLVGLPRLADRDEGGAVALADAMIRSGSLVFGGGHVVLPLLDQAVVAPGWVGEQDFLAGYGLAQAMPGPLFSFSAYLGAIQEPSPNGVVGAGIAALAIFLPSFLLLWGLLPFWSSVRRHPPVQAVLAGVGAAVVGSWRLRCGTRC